MASAEGPSSIRTTRGTQFWTENRRANWKVVSHFINRGVYVAFFATVSVLCGPLAFKETVPSSAWLGLGLIVVGGLVIQFGHNWAR